MRIISRHPRDGERTGASILDLKDSDAVVLVIGSNGDFEDAEGLCIIGACVAHSKFIVLVQVGEADIPAKLLDVADAVLKASSQADADSDAMHARVEGILRGHSLARRRGGIH